MARRRPKIVGGGCARRRGRVVDVPANRGVAWLRRLPWVSLLAATACFPSGPDFQEASQLRGVRVIGVVPEPGSGAPGTTVHLNMEVFDTLQHPWIREASREATGLPEEGDPVVPLHIAWLGGCHNPPADAHFGCYPLLTEIARNLPDPLPAEADIAGSEAEFWGIGPSFATTIPDGILDGRQLEGVAPPFGVSFAFFAVCRGLLRPDPDITQGVPLRCEDDAGNPIAAGGFVRGFTRIYTYADSVNDNPQVSAVTVNGVDLEDQSCESDADCEDYGEGEFDSACATPVAPVLSIGSIAVEPRCLPAVKACDGPDCERLELRARLDPDSVELDPASAGGEGDAPEEILWVKYYAFGGLGRDESLINDRASGFNEDFSTRWLPPSRAASDPLPIWGVTQDSRGGTAVTRWDVVVTE